MIRNFIKKIFHFNDPLFCAECNTTHYKVVGNGVLVMKRSFYGCPKFKAVVQSMKYKSLVNGHHSTIGSVISRLGVQVSLVAPQYCFAKKH